MKSCFSCTFVISSIPRMDWYACPTTLTISLAMWCASHKPILSHSHTHALSLPLTLTLPHSLSRHCTPLHFTPLQPITESTNHSVTLFVFLRARRRRGRHQARKKSCWAAWCSKKEGRMSGQQCKSASAGTSAADRSSVGGTGPSSESVKNGYPPGNVALQRATQHLSPSHQNCGLLAARARRVEARTFAPQIIEHATCRGLVVHGGRRASPSAWFDSRLSAQSSRHGWEAPLLTTLFVWPWKMPIARCPGLPSHDLCPFRTVVVAWAQGGRELRDLEVQSGT